MVGGKLKIERVMPVNLFADGCLNEYRPVFSNAEKRQIGISINIETEMVFWG